MAMAMVPMETESQFQLVFADFHACEPRAADHHVVNPPDSVVNPLDLHEDLPEDLHEAGDSVHKSSIKSLNK
jgi:hypothetical protein